MSKKWFPLESNPEVMSRYVSNLGVDPKDVSFHDVFGLDDDLLGMIPQPVLAVLLLYPITKENEEASAKDLTQVDPSKLPKGIFFCKQTIPNACGTVGLLHAVSNNLDNVPLAKGMFFHNFFDASASMTPEDRATLLEKDDGLDKAQTVATAEGQTQNQSIDTPINLHFIALVHKDGVLYEMDGRKPCPLPRATCEAGDMLKASAEVIKMYMALNPNELNFTMVAMVKN